MQRRHEALLLACDAWHATPHFITDSMSFVEITCLWHLHFQRVGVMTPGSFFSVGGRPLYVSLLISL